MPLLQVSWYKENNLLLSQTESVRFQRERDRHTLILRSAQLSQIHHIL